jgi:hypothetical protein
MEIIIVLIAVVLATAIYFGRKKPVEPTSIDTWTPPKEMHLTVEEPAPSVAVEAVTTVVENKPAKKKPATKKAPAAKKAPAKKTKSKKV